MEAFKIIYKYIHLFFIKHLLFIHYLINLSFK